jgi:truncated hemoglobin YjbI
MSTELLHSGANERRHIMLDKLGGKDVLQKATDIFYDRQVHDEKLAKFFHGSDLTILKWHQFNLMGIAFTSVPENFDVEHLILVRHEHLFDQGLDETYFDHTVELFVETLTELEVDPELIVEAKSVIYPLRKYFEEGAELARQRRRNAARKQILGQVVIGTLVAAWAFTTIKVVKKLSRHGK